MDKWYGHPIRMGLGYTPKLKGKSWCNRKEKNSDEYNTE
jgi:hypothetical protein